MKVVLVGGGGREHALAWKIAQSPLLTELVACPGNPGIARHARLADVRADDVEGVVALATREAADLVVVGPEAPLALGLADALTRAGILVFGPTRSHARLESSKAHAKELMRRHNIPTARSAVFDRHEIALDYVQRHPVPVVIKADGLAAGKGVFVCETLGEAERALEHVLGRRALGAAGARVVIEEALVGEEASILALCDGRTLAVFESCQDHKRLGDGDTGPNTGGMGAYSPAPAVTPAIYARIERDILIPTLHALSDADTPYRGLIYFGLMLTDAGPMVLEYNCRFGDPETQPLMMRLQADLLELLLATAQGRLDSVNIGWDLRPAACVVLASAGYPDKHPVGLAIEGIEQAESDPNVAVFHSGTAIADGRLTTAGGRVLGVTALGKDLRDARDAAYRAAWRIQFTGKTFRKDIGEKGIDRPPPFE